MTNDKIDTGFFKEKLEEELAVVEHELEALGHKNPDNPKDWEADSPTNFETDNADENETADKIEELEENNAVLSELEKRYNDVKAALDKIEGGIYGTCEVCSLTIEEERLIANPAARTCKEHLDSAIAV